MSDAARTLAGLRWGADDRIVNHFGDEVWLRDHGAGPGGGRLVTECCRAFAPCDRHRRLAEAA